MRTKKGLVTSAKMQKTVTVTVSRLVMHPKYRKRYPMSKKFLADTGEFTVKEGDTVLIGETRPISKNKHFRVLEVIASGSGLASHSLSKKNCPLTVRSLPVPHSPPPHDTAPQSKGSACGFYKIFVPAKRYRYAGICQCRAPGFPAFSPQSRKIG